MVVRFILDARSEIERMVLDEISNLVQRRFDDLKSGGQRFSKIHFTRHRATGPGIRSFVRTVPYITFRVRISSCTTSPSDR